MIRVEGVSKTFAIPHQRPRTLFHHVYPRGYTYEIFPALQEVTLSVRAGESLGLLGPNGSGKTTLLRVMAGIYPPSAGTVRVDGPVAAILDLGVGFQGFLSVRDNVLLYGVLLGVPRRRLQQDLGEILERAGVARFADARLETLSTGMRMRLGFTIALRADAPVLLLDEALAVGDESFRNRSLAELARWRAEGRTLVSVSHDAELLAVTCDRVAVLHAGRVRGEGAPRAMIELYRSL